MVRGKPLNELAEIALERKREEPGIGLQSLAQELGIDPKTVSDIFSGGIPDRNIRVMMRTNRHHMTVGDLQDFLAKFGPELYLTINIDETENIQFTIDL